MPCDLKDFDAIDRLGAAVFERWKRLDILVANAGVLGPITPIPHIDPPQWDQAIAVNVTANYRLIRSLDLPLRSSDSGRAVFVSSGAGSKSQLSAYRAAYAVTKAGLDALARTYAAETATTSNVKVMVTYPGPLRTKMRAAVAPGEDPMTLRTPEDFAPKVAVMCAAEWTETGKVYDFKTDRVQTFRGPE